MASDDRIVLKPRDRRTAEAAALAGVDETTCASGARNTALAAR